MEEALLVPAKTTDGKIMTHITEQFTGLYKVYICWKLWKSLNICRSYKQRQSELFPET